MLKSWLLLVSALSQEDIIAESKRQSFRLDPTDTMLVLGAVLMIVGLLFFWALYIRKRPDTKHGAPRLLTSPYSDSRHSGHTHSRRRVRRRRHRDHYPRNPTLGETGGLPPVREEPPEPAQEETGQGTAESPRPSK